MQCKEGRLRGEKLLPQGGVGAVKLPEALRLLFMIYRVVAHGGTSHGDPSQARGTNNPMEGSGSCREAGQDW